MAGEALGRGGAGGVFREALELLCAEEEEVDFLKSIVVEGEEEEEGAEGAAAAGLARAREVMEECAWLVAPPSRGGRALPSRGGLADPSPRARCAG